MVSKVAQTDRFVPLDKTSQLTNKSVLFFDSSLPLTMLYKASLMRFNAAYKLLDKIGAMPDNPFTASLTSELSRVTSILLSDANSILKAYHLKSSATNKTPPNN